MGHEICTHLHAHRHDIGGADCNRAATFIFRGMELLVL